MLSLQIDVLKIDKSRLKSVTRKNGEQAMFLDLVTFDRVDEHGNEGFLTQSLSKDERASGMKLPILGNWKTLGAGRPQMSQHTVDKGNGYAPQRTVEPHPLSTEGDDIPF